MNLKQQHNRQHNRQQQKHALWALDSLRVSEQATQKLQAGKPIQQTALQTLIKKRTKTTTQKQERTVHCSEAYMEFGWFVLLGTNFKFYVKVYSCMWAYKTQTQD